MSDVIRTAIARGKITIGTCQVIPGGFAAECLGGLGFPWILVDLQHGAIELSGLMEVVQALELTGTAILVRPRSIDPPEIMRILDFGVLGIVAPLVNSVEDAQKLAGSISYPPEGFRSLGPLRKLYGGGVQPAKPLCFAMIETLEGVENIDVIAAQKGIDGLWLGPGDMALSLGVEGKSEPVQEVLDVAKMIVASCKRNEKIPGSFAFSDAGANALIHAGMRILTIGADVHFILNDGRRHLSALSDHL